MLEENLKDCKSETAAVERCDALIKLAKSQKMHVIHLIVGHGSTGGSHKTLNAILDHLDFLLKSKRIKGFSKGILDIFDEHYQKMPYKELISDKDRRKGNEGTLFVVF